MKKNKEIERLRKTIDRIDLAILQALNQRAENVRKIFEEKKKTSFPSFDPSREKRLIERMKNANTGPLKSEDVEIIVSEMLKVFRSFGRSLKIAYLGPGGTFTHQAAMNQFGAKNEFVPCRTTEHVFREVEKERVDYGVVPFENSSEGVVTHTVDMFVESEIKIINEILLAIHQFLLSKGNSIKNIKTIYSHPQAFAQCQKWIEENLPRAALRETDSTTAAAKKAKREKDSASIGSVIAAKIYGLNIVADRIEDFRDNITRFLVIGRETPPQSGNDKTSILFSIKDSVGALHDMLVPFKESKINLTRIESRPSKKKVWEYVFFVELIGHKDDEKVKKALLALKKNCVFLKILGSYPQAG